MLQGGLQVKLNKHTHEVPSKHHLWITLSSLFKSVLLSVWKIPVQIKKTILEFMLHYVLSLQHIHNPLSWLVTHLGSVVQDEQLYLEVLNFSRFRLISITLRECIWLIEGALTTTLGHSVAKMSLYLSTYSSYQCSLSATCPIFLLCHALFHDLFILNVNVCTV